MVNTYAILSGFYCSMETPRRIRLGTRIYIIRNAAAVTQEHVLVCLTRKVTWPENDTVLVLAFEIDLMDGWSK